MNKNTNKQSTAKCC